jgi:hypothetical protein
LTTDQVAALSGRSYTPLALDLNGNGVQTLSIAERTVFDLDASGRPEFVGWIGSGDGLLVHDIDGDGVIDNGTELFGSATDSINGGKAVDGYAALAQFDANNDGKIDASDNIFKDLAVWVDANSNGLTEAGEVKSLTDLGIASLDLNAQGTSISSNGNTIGLVSSYTTTEGEQKEMVDVWFAASGDINANAADLAQALDAYMAEAPPLAQTDSLPPEQVKAEAEIVSLAATLSLFDAGGNALSSSTVPKLSETSMVDVVKAKLVDNGLRNVGLLGGTNSNSG